MVLPVRRHFVDNAPTQTLSAGVNSSATTIPLISAAGLPTTFPYRGTLDLGTASAEQVLVTAAAGLNLTVTRSANGQGAFSHLTGATFNHTADAIDFDEANAHVSSSSGVHNVSGDVVGTTDAQTLANKTLTGSAVTGTAGLIYQTAADTDVGWQVKNSGGGVTAKVTGAGDVTAHHLAVTNGANVTGGMGISGGWSAAGGGTVTNGVQVTGGTTTDTWTSTGSGTVSGTLTAGVINASGEITSQGITFTTVKNYATPAGQSGSSAISLGIGFTSNQSEIDTFLGGHLVAVSLVAQASGGFTPGSTAFGTIPAGLRPANDSTLAWSTGTNGHSGLAKVDSSTGVVVIDTGPAVSGGETITISGVYNR